ncbi:MAG: transposase [Nitrospinota bacterium]
MFSILRGHGKYYRLALSTVMPNHVHLLFQPLKKAEFVYYSLQEILKPVKGATARRINQLTGGKGSFWLDESFDRIIRDETEWREKYQYIRNNAFKAGLTDKPENYEWLLEMESL